MSDRPHAPPTQRLRDARRSGDVAQSRELTAGLSLLAAVLLLACLTGPLLQSLASLSRQQWGGAGDRIDALQLSGPPLARVLVAALPLLAALLAAAWLASGLQTGMLWAPGRLSPNGRRFHWGDNSRRIGADAANAVIGWVKATVTLAAALAILALELPKFTSLPSHSFAATVQAAADTVARAATELALVLVAVGLVDLLWQHARRRRRLRMTDQQHRQWQRDQQPDASTTAARREAGHRLRGG